MEGVMGNVYFYTALIGGMILVVQTALLLFGAGGDGDADVGVDDIHDPSGADAHSAEASHGADAFFKLLSLKTLVAFATFFGLAGLAGGRSGLEPLPALLVAGGAGTVALYLVAYLMSALNRLQSKGNVDLRNAVGKKAQVYLVIPSGHSGAGKVLVGVQGRKVECRAVTSGPEIPTGQEVDVIGLTGSDTLDVVPASKAGEKGQ